VVVLGVVFLVVSVVLSFFLPSTWRGTNGNLNRGWASGPDWVRGCYRCIIPATLGTWMLGIAAVLDSDGGWRLVVSGLCGGVLLFVVGPLGASIWFWNRPSFLVPPAWRGNWRRGHT
jgi:hypothetical protein